MFTTKVSKLISDNVKVEDDATVKIAVPVVCHQGLIYCPQTKHRGNR